MADTMPIRILRTHTRSRPHSLSERTKTAVLPIPAPSAPVPTQKPETELYGAPAEIASRNSLCLQHEKTEKNDLNTPSVVPDFTAPPPSAQMATAVGDPYGREYWDKLVADEWARPAWPASLVNGTWNATEGFILDSDRQALIERIRREREAEPDEF